MNVVIFISSYTCVHMVFILRVICVLFCIFFCVLFCVESLLCYQCVFIGVLFSSPTLSVCNVNEDVDFLLVGRDVTGPPLYRAYLCREILHRDIHIMYKSVSSFSVSLCICLLPFSDTSSM